MSILIDHKYAKVRISYGLFFAISDPHDEVSEV
jgi:hypothetical protein